MIISTGDVIAIKGRGVISNLISKFSGTVSHVGLVTGRSCGIEYCPDYNHINVTQALSTVKTLSLTTTMANAQFGYCLHSNSIPVEARKIMADYALSRLGQAYPYSNLFWQSMKQITGNPKWTEYLDSDREEICSELVAIAYLKAGYDFGVSPRDCTPTNCLDFALKQLDWLVQPL